MNYIADHDLLITLLDTTVDSAGLFTLLIPYHYNKLYWFLIIFLEITIYAIIGAVLTTNTTWVNRNIAFLVITIVFGINSYINNPYTELIDKWLDFVGRILIIFILLCTIICAELRPYATNNINTELYKPWDSASYIIHSIQIFGLYEILDLLMVLFFYAYLFYILYAVGVFGVVERMIESFQFGYHDHILDYLVENLDQRTYGLENIFTGLILIQQWDDIIKLQRRYASFAWPDVRPTNIISLFAKLLEIKWASMFNLTLNNLRSSLGLSILHTVMFSADGDVARWIIYRNPDLLLVQDSQNDTPITIALKECAYFLMAYGEQNNGHLDDGTAYSDEAYMLYYSEIDDLRDEVYNNGEFVSDLCIQHILTSADMLSLRDEGIYREPPKVEYIESPKKPSKLDIHGNKKFTEEELNAIKLEKKRKNYAKMLLDKAQQEKTSIFMKRFPEDELIDDYEVGRMAAWNVISANVPEMNIYLDNSIVKKTLRNSSYTYELPEYDVIRGRVVLPGAMGIDHTLDGPTATVTNSNAAAGGGGGGGGRNTSGNTNTGDIENNVTDIEHDDDEHDKPAPLRLRPTTPGGGFVQDKDLQYIVRTTRKLHKVEKSIEVPMTHPEIRNLIDWDKKPRRRRGSGRRDSIASQSQYNGSERPYTATSAGASDFGGTSTRRSSIYSLNSDLFSTSSGELISRLTKLNSIKTDQETRWRICKFAEILMSEEMSKSCSKLRWNVSDFKAFNKLASATQGKVAQNLAMTCNLNAPLGFVRVSEWSASAQLVMFDEMPDTDIPMIVKTIVAIVSSAEHVTRAATEYISNAVVLPEMSNLRGRARRRRRSSRSLSHRDNTQIGDETNQNGDNNNTGDRLLSDRVIQYLAESYVCSNSRLNLDDCELSYNGRISWRAIARALRLKHCSFILPSLFVPPKLICLKHLILTRNELDCGDAVLISDILTHQLSLIYVDLSYNRIGGRGMSRIAQAIRDHPNIHTFKIDFNTIGKF